MPRPLFVWSFAVCALLFNGQFGGGGPVGRKVNVIQPAATVNITHGENWGYAKNDDSPEWRIVEPLALSSSLSSNFMLGLPELFLGNSRVLFAATTSTCMINIILCIVVAIFAIVCRGRTKVHCVEEWIETEKARPYLVTFVTGSRWGAGSKTTVRLTMAGSKKRMPMHVICPYYYERNNMFRRGGTDNFLLDVAGGIGELKNVVIQCSTDRPGKEAWYLNYVRVVDMKYNVSWYCPCHRWLRSKAQAKDSHGDMVLLRPETMSRKSLFDDNLWRGLHELHLWVKIFTWNRFDSILLQVLNLSLLATLCLSFMFVNSILTRHIFTNGYFQFSPFGWPWRAGFLYLFVTIIIGIIGSLGGWAIRSAQARRSYRVLVAVAGKHEDLGCCNPEAIEADNAGNAELPKPLKRVASYDINANNSGVSSGEESENEYDKRMTSLTNATNSAKPPRTKSYSGSEWNAMREADETSHLLIDGRKDTDVEPRRPRTGIRKTWTRVWKQMRPGRNKSKMVYIPAKAAYRPAYLPPKSALRAPVKRKTPEQVEEKQASYYSDFVGKWVKNILFDLRSHITPRPSERDSNTNQNNRNDDDTVDEEDQDGCIRRRLANDLAEFLEDEVSSFHSETVLEKSPLLRQLSDLSIEGIQQELVLGPAARKLSFTLTYNALSNALAAVEHHATAALTADKRHWRAVFERIGGGDVSSLDDVGPRSDLKTREPRNSMQLVATINADYAARLNEESLVQVALASLLGVLSDEVVVAITESVERLRERQARTFSAQITSRLQSLLSRRLSRLSVGGSTARPTDDELNNLLLLAFDGKTTRVDRLIGDVSRLLASEKRAQLYLSNDVTLMAFARQFLDTVIGNALLACHVHFLRNITAIREATPPAECHSEWRQCLEHVIDKTCTKLDANSSKRVVEVVLDMEVGRQIIALAYSRAKGKLVDYSVEVDMRKQICEGHSMAALGRCIVDGSNEQEDQLNILEDVTQEVRNFALRRACLTVARDLGRLLTFKTRKSLTEEEEQALVAMFVNEDSVGTSTTDKVDDKARHDFMSEIGLIRDLLTDVNGAAAKSQLLPDGGEGDFAQGVVDEGTISAPPEGEKHLIVKATTSLGDVRRSLPPMTSSETRTGMGGNESSQLKKPTRKSSEMTVQRSASDHSQNKRKQKHKKSGKRHSRGTIPVKDKAELDKKVKIQECAIMQKERTEPNTKNKNSERRHRSTSRSKRKSDDVVVVIPDEGTQSTSRTTTKPPQLKQCHNSFPTNYAERPTIIDTAPSDGSESAGRHDKSCSSTCGSRYMTDICFLGDESDLLSPDALRAEDLESPDDDTYEDGAGGEAYSILSSTQRDVVSDESDIPPILDRISSSIYQRAVDQRRPDDPVNDDTPSVGERKSTKSSSSGFRSGYSRFSSFFKRRSTEKAATKGSSCAQRVVSERSRAGMEDVRKDLTDIDLLLKNSVSLTTNEGGECSRGHNHPEESRLSPAENRNVALATRGSASFVISAAEPRDPITTKKQDVHPRAPSKPPRSRRPSYEDGKADCTPDKFNHEHALAEKRHSSIRLRRSGHLTHLHGRQATALRLQDSSSDSESDADCARALGLNANRRQKHMCVCGVKSNSNNSSAWRRVSSQRRDVSLTDNDTEHSDAPLLNTNNSNNNKYGRKPKKKTESSEDEESDDDASLDRGRDTAAEEETDADNQPTTEDDDGQAEQDDEEEEDKEDDDDEAEHKPETVKQHAMFEDDDNEPSMKRDAADEAPYADYEPSEKHEQATCFGKMKSCVSPKKQSDYDAEEDLMAKRQQAAVGRRQPKSASISGRLAYDTPADGNKPTPTMSVTSGGCRQREPIFVSYRDTEVLKRPCEKCLPKSAWYIVFVAMTLVSVCSFVGCIYFGAEMDIGMSYTWLTLLIVSVVVDIFIIEPLKVVCVAAFMSFYANMLL